jgi:hypothetical protein
MSETKVVMGIEEAAMHAAQLGVSIDFETPSGLSAHVESGGGFYVDVSNSQLSLAEAQASSAVHGVGCACNVCHSRMLAERGVNFAPLPVKKGTHDWSAQPRIMVDPPERHVITVLGLGLASAFFLVCAVLGALLLARAIHDAVTSGWSWQVIGESLRDRLGPA